jgi:exoribonuclease-2
MNLLFEEDGAFKTGTILTDNDASLQVETPHGKRLKLKSKDVLMRFAQPSAGELLERAEAEAEGLDTEFLWEVCGDDGIRLRRVRPRILRPRAQPGGVRRRAAAPACRADLLPPQGPRPLPQGPRRNPAGRPRRPREEAPAGRRHRAHARRTPRRPLPEELKPLVRQLLYKPDRNRLETKALEAACAESGKSPARLLLDCGALASSHELHFDRFLFEYFPAGTDFPAVDAPSSPADLPLADVRAFSIDDAATTEIDDAFSVTPTAAGWRIGIHIAAPGLGFGRDSASTASPASACPRCTCRATRSPCCPRTSSAASPSAKAATARPCRCTWRSAAT